MEPCKEKLETKLYAPQHRGENISEIIKAIKKKTRHIL